MIDREKTVVVDGGERHSNYGWLIALVVVVLLVILFFAFGGMRMFNGGGTNVNVTTPDTVKVQPSSGTSTGQ